MRALIRHSLCTLFLAALAAPGMSAQAVTRWTAPDEGGSAATTPAAKKTPAAKPRTTTRPTTRRRTPKRVPRPALRGSAPTDALMLQNDLRALVAASGAAGRWGILVVSLSKGDTLYENLADAALLPASTLKLYTASMALERFGPAHQFRTEILRDGELLGDGTMRGNLYLKGAGDPALSPRYAGFHEGVKPMEALADLVADAGVKRVSGDIVGDASAFEDRRVPEGWRTRYLQASYAARVSALSFNENLAHVNVRATSSGAKVSFDQPVRGIALQSSVTLRRGSRSAAIRVWQDTLADRFRVTGWIGTLAKPRSYQVIIERPEQFATGAFRAALEARGIVVDGKVRTGPAPLTALTLTALASPPLAQLVATMNGESNNHFAELLFRNAARVEGGVGSADIAYESLRTFLGERVGISPDAVYAADGSGLSTLDRVTPRSMVKLLAYAERAPWGPVLRASLPVAGRTETLRGRMRYTAAQGNLRAKTGTTAEVASLGGYVTSRNGESLAFSFIYNGHDLWRAREAIDAMGATLAGFSR